ncbi:MAG: helix-turn-helix domain-containing protein [Nostoc sp. EkiNYC01]|nr:helix-turn-helix transcriptional regulator [Nostoc sp. EkiNYC01]
MAKQPNIGKLVRALWQELNLSPETFAAEFGVTFPTINRWENRRATPFSLAMQRISTLVIELGDGSKILQATYFQEKE